MAKKLIPGFCAFLVLLVLFGCGQGSAKVTSENMKAFEGASPDLQQKWARAQAAGATNDYVQCIMILRSMLSPSLSKDQIEAVQNALSTYDAKMMKAVNRGDPAAQKAYETLRSPGSLMGR